MPNELELTDVPEPSAVVCANCSESEDDCECSHCSDCGEAVDNICPRCDCCDDCCECSHCGRCGEPCEETCSNCDRCDGCCSCYTCQSCDERVSSDYFCSNCDRCESCCHCDNELETYRGHLVFHTAKYGEFKQNPSKRHISLEVEVAYGRSRDMHSTLRSWQDSLVEDGSLPDEGWELNLNPSNGDTFIAHTNKIASALFSAGAGVDRSCGMHCHVDARDFSWLDLYKLCKLYAKVEDGMFQLVAKSRRSNHYSEECGDFYNFKDFKTFKRDLISRLYGWTPSKQKPQTTYGRSHSGAHQTSDYRAFYERGEKYHSSRYHALNLHSFFYRQTVEFRHHHGTTKAEKMQGWGMVCAQVMDAASRLTLKQIDAMQGPSFSVLLSLLPDSLAQWAKTRRDKLAGLSSYQTEVE